MFSDPTFWVLVASFMVMGGVGAGFAWIFYEINRPVVPRSDRNGWRIRMNGIQVSVSQIDSYESCPRAWWFDKVARLPRGQRPYGMVFGDVLHAVVERFYKADPSGRGPDGRPVDLYPPGWEYATQDNRRLEPGDDEKVKALVEAAERQGFLARRPGQEVERPFGVVMDPEGPVYFNGKVDLKDGGEILDHKTVKSMRYAESDAKRKDNSQLLAYAHLFGATKVSHLVYDRTSGRVDYRSSDVTPEETKARWDRLTASAREMRELAYRGLREDQWAQVPCAMDGAGAGPGACSEYGGCRYLSICSRQETVEKFRRRYLRLAGVVIEEENMGSLSDLLSNLGGTIPVPTGTDPRPKVEETQGIAPPPAEPAEDLEAPDPRCPACDETGRSSKGGYCVCPMGTRRAQEDKKAELLAVDQRKTTAERKQKKPCTKCSGPIEKGQDYVSDGDGKRHVECPPMATSIGDLKITDPALAKVMRQAAERVEEISKANQEIGTATILMDEKHVAGPVPTAEAPPPNIRILHGAAILKEVGTSDPSYTAAEVLAIALQIAGNTLQEFYAADCWKRRDALKGLGKQVAHNLGDAYVIVRGSDQDEQALIAGLAPYASLEIAGLS